MIITPKFQTQVIKLAGSIACKLTEQNWRHVSIILDGKTPVSCGFNHPYKTHPIGYRYKHRYHSIHAEVHAITSYQGSVQDFKHMSIVNIRLDKAGIVKMSRPCPNCLPLLRELQFKQIFFTNRQGQIEELQHDY